MKISRLILSFVCVEMCVLNPMLQENGGPVSQGTNREAHGGGSGNGDCWPYEVV